MKIKLVSLTLTLILGLFMATPAFAQEPLGDQVVFGRNLVLESGDRIDGDVVVFGGNVEMAAHSQINGDLAVFGGQAEIDGTVNGDIGMVGGNIELGESAVVNGSIGLVGGDSDLDEGAVVNGQIQSLNRFGLGSRGNFNLDVPTPPIAPTAPSQPERPERPERPEMPEIPAIPPSPRFHFESGPSWTGQAFNFVGHIVGNITFLLALVAVSWLVAAFMPEQMRLVGDTMTSSGPMSFVVGLLTTAVALVAGILLVITVCLAFIPILGWLALGIALLFGWIAAGQIIGERLLVASGRPYPNFVGSTLLGVAVLTLVTKMPIVSLIPCLGFILGFVGGLIGLIVGLTGLGAVILTRFGTQPYIPGAGRSPRRPVPGPGPVGGQAVDIPEASALERAEAELRAKIKEALAEADFPTGEPEPPAVKPAPDQPEDPAQPDEPGRPAPAA